MRLLSRHDPEVAGIIKNEENRIENTLNLIAAENHPPQSVLEAQGSVFSMKAAEGYPGNRFHAGCVYADELEALAVSRAMRLFGADHANVQPHSGVSANLAVYFSVLDVGDRILSMKLSHGGHLSHGDPASITGKCFDFKHYGLNPETELIDYDEVRDLAESFKPKMIIAGASSYPRLIDYARMAEIAQSISAYLMVDMAHIAGLVAGGVIPSPVPHSDFVTFTTYKTLRAGRGGVILCKHEHARKITKTIFPGSQGTPSLNLMAAKAVCFNLAMSPEFKTLQENTIENARLLATEFERLGYRIVSGGTDSHMVLLDLRPKQISGYDAEKVLESIGIVVNRNVIPGDPERPDIASGIRIGSAAAASRGMGKEDMIQIAALVDKALVGQSDCEVFSEVASAVAELCNRFPVYGAN